MVGRAEELNDLVEGARRADRELATTVRALSDDELRGPSALPDWTRSHVVAHVARHAEAHARMLNGDTDRQYPGGFEQRAADIEATRADDVASALADLERSVAALWQAWDAVDDWDAPVRYLVGTGPARSSPYNRWREVAIHHVDLDAGFTASDWTDAFVRVALPEALDTLAPRRAHGEALQVLVSESDVTRDVGDGDSPIVVTGPGWAVVAWCWNRAVPDGALRAERDGTAVEVPDLGSWV